MLGGVTSLSLTADSAYFFLGTDQVDLYKFSQTFTGVNHRHLLVKLGTHVIMTE